MDILVPSRLGTNFRWLIASSWTSNLGDGIAIAAGPLLIASQTDEPLLVALAALLQWLPPLVFGLFAGALSDRLDRRLLVVTVDVVRSVVLLAIAASVLTDSVSIGLVLGALFLLATAEVFADNTSQTLLPMLVAREDLAIANQRLQTGFITVNQLAGPPIGASLFAAGMALPFVGHAVLMAMGAILVSRIALPEHGGSSERTTRIREEIAEGFAWVRRHAAVRTLVLTIFSFNITFGAAWSVLVLYATQRLGLGAVGFGLLTTIIAIGGILGTLSYGWITRRLSLGNIMRIGLVIETFTHLGLALTTSAPVAMANLPRLRRARLRVGNDVNDHPAARRAERPPGAGREREHRWRVRRSGPRIGNRRAARAALRRHRPVLVRLWRIRAVPAPDLAAARPHRSRRAGSGRARGEPRVRARGRGSGCGPTRGPLRCRRRR